MTFKKPIDGRTFLPDNADLVAVVSDTVRERTLASREDREATLAAWRKDKEINHMMRQRHGVNM
jgi:hypothetical protein